MPIAQPYTSLGVFNGFPFCLESVDVTGFEYVAPLTLEQCMNLYWNINGITAEIDSGAAPYDTRVVDINAGTYNEFNSIDQNGSVSLSSPFEPKDRDCVSGTPSGFNAITYGQLGQFIGWTQISPEPVTLFDNGNFIGYGFKDNVIYTSSQNIYGAYFMFKSYEETGGFAGSGQTKVVEYSTAINGIPLVAVFIASYLANGWPGNINGLQATIFEGDGVTVHERITYSNLDFYTYV